MFSFFHEGGFGMYPTAVFGFFAVASAALWASRPEKKLGAQVMNLTLLTFFSGVLGLAVGLTNTLRYLEQVPRDEQFKIAALGCAESLHNVVLALIVCVIAALLASVATWRNQVAVS